MDLEDETGQGHGRSQTVPSCFASSKIQNNGLVPFPLIPVPCHPDYGEIK